MDKDNCSFTSCLVSLQIPPPRQLNEMKLICTIILCNFLIIYCSSLSVGYKVKNCKYQEEAILIIGEISNRVSSVQINNILQQLKIFKNRYVKEQNDGILIETKLGNRIKTSRNIASLYEADCNEFINFLRESTIGIQTYLNLNLYSKPSFYIKSVNSLSEILNISLDDPILFELSELFPENMQIENKRSESPILDYDAIYGESRKDLRRNLLEERKKERRMACRLNDYCSIS